MNYTTIATDESIEKVKAALKERNFEPLAVATGAEALEKIKELIPAGASVMNGASTTLQEIGFIDYLKGGEYGWNNLHASILAESNSTKQALLRKQSVLSEFYLGSVHGLAETGEMVIASNSGSQLPHLAFTSPNVILVVGAQKIVPTLKDALERIDAYVVALEDERMRKTAGYGTSHNKTLILHKENPAIGRKVYVIIVKEKLGF